MFTEETGAHGPTSVTAAPSLACDLSWLLSVAARPSMQARYPQLAEMFNGREDLADRVRLLGRRIRGDLLHRDAGPGPPRRRAGRDRPRRAVAGDRAAVATVPLDLEMPSESPEERATYLDRFRQAPGVARASCGRTSSSSREVWAPVDDMWQQALPVIEEAGRHVVAQYEARSVIGDYSYRRGVTSCGTDLPDDPLGRRGRAVAAASSCPACSSARACTWSSPASS